ncbi:carbohydrate sulfotransferase 11-like [Diadema antillarum]|uniref:carbohydrate sulfotransferase 11-like n=1 Tax=Diadema antillarum TaxID=105358 RepID=UPI003A89231A
MVFTTNYLRVVAAATATAAALIVACEVGFLVMSAKHKSREIRDLYLNPAKQAIRAPRIVPDPDDEIRHTQSKRQATLDKECRRIGYPTEVPEYTAKHIFVIEKYRLVYCFIPKVGCSNWKRILMVLDEQVDAVDGLTSDEVHIKSHFKFLSSYPPDEQEKILRTYQKFVFVRHPFERLVSVFRNKFEDLEYYRHNRFFHPFAREIIKEWRPRATNEARTTGENVTWEEFVKYLTHTVKRAPFEARRSIHFSDHWREMVSIASPCEVDYNFIGKLEHVSTESKYLLRKWGVEDRVSYPGSETSRPTNSSSMYESYFRRLPRKDLLKLWSIYRKDFYFFGYKKPPYI